MIENTLQTLIDEVKELSGQTNASNAKVIRALNRGVDSLSLLSLVASGRVKGDSSKHGDIPRVTTTVSAGTTKLTLETELATIQQMDILVDGKYVRLEPIDRRDNDRTPLDTTYTTGTPKYYDVEAGVVYLYPVPDNTFTIRLTYGRPHPRFSTADLALTTGIEPLHEDYVMMFAADRIMLGTNDPSKASVRNDLVILRQDVINSLKGKDEDRPQRLKPKLHSSFTNSFNNK